MSSIEPCHCFAEDSFVCACGKHAWHADQLDHSCVEPSPLRVFQMGIIKVYGEQLCLRSAFYVSGSSIGVQINVARLGAQPAAEIHPHAIHYPHFECLKRAAA